MSVGGRAKADLWADWMKRALLSPQMYMPVIVLGRDGVFEGKPYCRPSHPDALTSALASATLT